MHICSLAGRFALMLLAGLAASELRTVTQYPSVCSAKFSSATALYTSGSSTYTSPLPSTIAASSTPTPRIDLCPNYNGQVYGNPSIGTYDVSCDIALTGTRLPNIQARQDTWQSSQQSCITACQQSAACIAINLGHSSCEYFSNVTETIDALGFASLLKRDSAPANVSSVANGSATTLLPSIETSPSSYSNVERTIVSTLTISVPYTTTAISQQVSILTSTSIGLVPTTIVSSYFSTAISTVPTTIERTLTTTAISTVQTQITTTIISLSTGTLVTTIDQTRFVTATTAIPTTVVSSYISTLLQTVYFPSVTTAISSVVSTVYFPAVTTTTSLVPTTVVSISISSYPVITVRTETSLSLVPTTLIQTLVETSLSYVPTTVVQTYTTQSIVTATPSVITLPNNLGTQFGGVDSTKGFRNPNFMRPGLFKLAGLEGGQYETQTVYYGTTDAQQWKYQIPEFLAFTWASQLNTETVTGETKRDYQHSYSQTLAANIGFAGFGLEIQDTFEETTMVETYQKYASIYARQQIYHVSVVETPEVLQNYLSERAIRLFQEGNAKTIVDTFGTHYMTSATFGGMRRFSSSLDARDESISTKLGQALKFKFAAETDAGEVSEGASSENTDATVQKISTSMDVKNSIVFGGTYVDGETTWIPSLYRNPSAVDFELASLTDLILDPVVKAAVQAEIDSRVQASVVTSTALALVMWENLGGRQTDSGSGADQDLETARTNSKQGWYILGQYGISNNDGWDPTQSKGLLIRNIPLSTDTFVKPPTGIERRWGKSSHYGLYEMTNTDPAYHGLSGFWYGDDNAQLQALMNDRAGMVHESLTRPAGDGGQLWNDGGSGAANEDAYVNKVYYGAPDDDSVKILQLPDGQPEAYFFHTYRQGGGGVEFLALDFTKVQFVTNNFINPA